MEAENWEFGTHRHRPGETVLKFWESGSYSDPGCEREVRLTGP